VAVYNEILLASDWWPGQHFPHSIGKSHCATILVVVKKLRELNDDYFPSNVPVCVVRL